MFAPRRPGTRLAGRLAWAWAARAWACEGQRLHLNSVNAPAYSLTRLCWICITSWNGLRTSSSVLFYSSLSFFGPVCGDHAMKDAFHPASFEHKLTEAWLDLLLSCMDVVDHQEAAARLAGWSDWVWACQSLGERSHQGQANSSEALLFCSLLVFATVGLVFVQVVLSWEYGFD